MTSQLLTQFILKQFTMYTVHIRAHAHTCTNVTRETEKNELTSMMNNFQVVALETVAGGLHHVIDDVIGRRLLEV